MKNIGKTISAFIICLAFFSCSNSFKENESQGGGIFIAVEDFAPRTVMPSPSHSDKGLLKDIRFEGKPSSESEYKLLRTWDAYIDLLLDNGIFKDDEEKRISGNWDFRLRAKLYDTELVGDKSVSVSATSKTTVSFSLDVDSSATEKFGAVKIDLNFSGFSYDKVTAEWATESEIELNCVDGYYKYVFEKPKVATGNYKVTFRYYKDDNVVFTYPTYVMVAAARMSYESFPNTTNNVKQEFDHINLIYDYNGGVSESDETIKSETVRYYALNPESAKIKGAEKITPPEGKKFTGWNTKPDGTGTRYSPKGYLNLTDGITLYAQWCSYEDYIFKIRTEDDLRAFFSYDYAVAKEIPGNAVLEDDIELTSPWEPNILDRSGFDGNGHSISNVTMVSNSYENAGFFTEVKSRVENLTIKSSEIITYHKDGSGGAIAGINNRRIINCAAEDVKISARYAGGIAGQNLDEITNPIVSGKTLITSGNQAGGITSENKGIITSPTVTGATIKDIGAAYYISGISGYNSGTITDATATGLKLIGKEKAYLNPIAVGLNSKVNGTTTESDNEMNGIPNVALNKEFDIPSTVSSRVVKFENFTVAKRKSKLYVKITADNLPCTGLLYKGKLEVDENASYSPANIPNSSSPNDSKCFWWTEYEKVTNSTPYIETMDIGVGATEDLCDLTFRIYNSGKSVTGTYYIELE